MNRICDVDSTVEAIALMGVGLKEGRGEKRIVSVKGREGVMRVNLSHSIISKSTQA